MIAKLSEFSAERKQEYENYYKNVMLSGVTGFKFLEPNKEFDENGLRFPADYLNKIDKAVVLLPLEIMAEYVDIITKTNIDNDNKAFIFHQIHDSDDDIDEIFKYINATAIGNLAYIALNCKDEKAKISCEKTLNRIFEITKANVLDQLNENI